MTHQNDHNKKLYVPKIHSPASTKFRMQDPSCKIEFRMILCLKYTLPPSTTFLWAHLRTDMWTITDRTMHHPSITNEKDYMFSRDTRRRLFFAPKPKNSCFTWSITHPATTLTFSPVDALFLDHKVQSCSSSLRLCTWKIIGHFEWCKITRRCDQLTFKVVFTACPAMLDP